MHILIIAVLIPKLVKEGFQGKNILYTCYKRSYRQLLLEDSAEIQEDDVKYINKKRGQRKGLPYLQPLYTIDDAKKAWINLIEVGYDQWYRCNGWSASYVIQMQGISLAAPVCI